MAGHLLQLKVNSVRGTFRRDSPYRSGAIATAIATVVVTATALAVIVASWSLSPELVRGLAVTSGILASVAAFVAAAVSPGGDDLDPRALVAAGRSPLRAAWESLTTSAIGIPAAGTAIVLLASLSLWRADALALAIGAASMLVGFCTLVTLARLGSLLGFLMDQRRVAGDVVAAAVFLAILLLSPVLFVAVTAPWAATGTEPLQRAAEVLAWTPIGAAWGAPSTALSGDLVSALGQFGVALATLAVAALLWLGLGTRLARRTLVDTSGREVLDLGFINRFGGSPARVVAARTITYWLRDRRYQVVNVSIVLLPLLALVPLAVVGVDARYLALLPVPLLAFFLGWTLHNDLAFDSTAVWLHITSGMDGRSDRIGRALPTLVVGGVIVVLGSAISGLIVGDWLWVVSEFGIAAGLLLATTGFSSVMSVLYPYAVARPGDSPYSQPVRSWGRGVLMHPVAGLLAILAVAPSIACGVIGILGGDWWWHVAALVLGLVAGAIVLSWGIARGGRLFDDRSSELMTFAMSS